MKVRDQNSTELVIVFVPTVIFANKIFKTFRGMVQLCLGVYWII